MFPDVNALLESFKDKEWAKCIYQEPGWGDDFANWLKRSLLLPFLNAIVEQVEKVITIDPELPEEAILSIATSQMVDLLSAQCGSARVIDPYTGQLISYGSHPSYEEEREIYVPLEGTIAGEVARTGQPYLVKNLEEEERFKGKHIIKDRGVHSMIAVPFEVPRFSPSDRETVGVIQLYFKDKDKEFDEVEVMVAKLLAKRLSVVMAQKKIYLLQKVREKRTLITDAIIKTAGTRGGLKLKDVFLSVMPGLKDIINAHMCVLFSVDKKLSNVYVEAVYPENAWTHRPGNVFSLNSEEVFEIIYELSNYKGNSIYEVVNSNYVFIVDPLKSELICDITKKFIQLNNINSLLYIPLVDEKNQDYIILFGSKERRKRYTYDEVEIFLYLGRELIKAQKMERLDDALHDFKNPAIAIAGFARRLKKLLKDDLNQVRDQIEKYADILLEETSRLQELALSIYHVGSEELVNLTQSLRRRFEINKEAIREQLRQNIALKEGPFDEGLMVLCYPLNLERVFDNILNNATKAIPPAGGILAIKTYRQDSYACAEITNTGRIPESELGALKDGSTPGRGLYITYRILKLMNGEISVKVNNNETTFILKFPNHALENITKTNERRD